MEICDIIALSFMIHFTVFIMYIISRPKQFPNKKSKNHPLSEDFFLMSIIGSWILILCFNLLLCFKVGTEFLIISIIYVILILALSIYSLVIFATLWYKAWESIQDEKARTTPGLAIGLSFIPIYNFYWIFQLSWGFSKDYNSFLDRHKLSIPKISDKLFLSFSMLSILNIIFFWLFLKLLSDHFWIFFLLIELFSIIELIIILNIISRICAAVNILRLS